MNIIGFPRGMFTAVDETTLSCEASDMGNRHLQRFDSGDIGFAIETDQEWVGSCPIGTAIYYRLQRVVKDEEGDIRFWEFRLMPYSHQKYPNWSYTFVVVDND